jgi:parallel beta-helix repeat protein
MEERRMKRVHQGLITSLVVLAAVAVFPAAGAAETIKVTTTIGAAISAAESGDTIVVPPGTYHEGDLVVTQDDLTIRGSKGAVLDASGHSIGIRVGADRITGDPPVCPPLSVDDFTLSGLTIRDATFTGVFLIGVEGFRVTGGRYVDNEEYGIFPRCSRDGLIDHNSGSGGEDATVYVGVDENITVKNNHLTNGVIGIELENTSNSFVRNNKLTGNVNGILVVVLDGLPTTSTENAVIERNVIRANNLPNPFPLPPPLFDELQLLPSGSGVLNVGGDGITIRNNVITHNDSFGIGLVDNPFGFGPPDDNRVIRNTVLKNGGDPDVRATLSGDLAYDGSGDGNCFADNVFETDDPPGIVSLFPCP